MITIYLDMDGVLADFHKAYYDDVPRDKQWNRARFRTMVMEHKIFEGLEMLPNAVHLLETVERYRSTHAVKVEILSSKGTYDGEQGLETARQKEYWLEKHGILYPANFVRSKIEKAKFAHGRAILIDDSEGCIIPFNDAGGHGILHTDQFHHETLETLYLKVDEIHAKL